MLVAAIRGRHVEANLARLRKHSGNRDPLRRGRVDQCEAGVSNDKSSAHRGTPWEYARER